MADCAVALQPRMERLLARQERILQGINNVDRVIRSSSLETQSCDRLRVLEERQEQILLAIAALEARVSGAPPPRSGTSRASRLCARQEEVLRDLLALGDRLQAAGVPLHRWQDRTVWSPAPDLSTSAPTLPTTLRSKPHPTPPPAAPKGEEAASGPVVAGGAAGATEHRLHAEMLARGLRGARFARVPAGYYDLTLEQRRGILGAGHIDQLCKSIVLENTQAPADVTDCSDRFNSKYYLVLVQYTASFSAEKVRQWVHLKNEGRVSKKKINFRLCPSDVSARLTGYEHNGVTPVGLADGTLPIIMSDRITALKHQGDFFWMGGGEVDLKLGCSASAFAEKYNCIVMDCTNN